MSEVLDWQRVADPHAAVRRAVRALRAGQLVAFPTETTYALTASGLVPEAVARLRACAGGDEPLALAVRGVAEARDWAPDLSPLGQRLARRFWPGPLTLALTPGVPGLTSRLPDAVRGPVCPQGMLQLRTPAHEAILEALHHLAGPLVLVPAPDGETGPGATDASGVLRSNGDRVDLVLDDGPSHYRQAPTVVRVNGNAWDVLRPGVVSADLLQSQSACVIMFVCTGNTCRSPLAEALAKKQLADRLGCAVEELPARGFLVLSAGLAAMPGGPAAGEAVDVARSHGADLSGHRSRPLTPELAAQADYLIGMTRDHVEALADHFPRLGARPRLLRPDGEDVPDPIGHDLAVYEDCAAQIWRDLAPLVAEVVPDPANPAAKS
jgi:protein-tyrosine phosphatase